MPIRRATAPSAGTPDAARPARGRRPAVVRRLLLTPHASRQLDVLAARWGLTPHAIVSIAVDAWARREGALATDAPWAAPPLWLIE